MSRLREIGFQLLITALLMWALVRLLLRFLGWPWLLAFVAVAGLASLTTWMLRYDRRRLGLVYAYPGAQQFIDLVCKATRFQPPVESEPAPSEEQFSSKLLLKDFMSFQHAERKLKAVVRGHDEQIADLLQWLQSSVLLRSKSTKRTGNPPLAVYLFVGPEGVGKRFLARKLGNLLYRRGTVLDLDIAALGPPESSAAALFGTGSADGVLTSAVRSQPYQLIVLQNIDRAGPGVMEGLQAIFANGLCIDPKTKGTVSFQNCVFILTTSRCVATLQAAREKTSGRRSWNSKAHEVLSAETPLSLPFLVTVQEVLFFDPLAPLEKAEAISLLMRKECRKYDLKLEYIEPELLAEEVAAISDDLGLATLPARVARLLHDPLVRASRDGMQSIVLRQNQITLVNSMRGLNQ